MFFCYRRGSAATQTTHVLRTGSGKTANSPAALPQSVLHRQGLRPFSAEGSSPPSAVCKRQRMMFIAIKTEDGVIKGKISFYCRMLNVTRQGFYKYLANKDRPWKYQDLADAMRAIASEDECNDAYGRIRMYQALLLKQPEGGRIPGERTVYRIMKEIGLSHRPKRKPNGITKADREAHKSDDLLKRDS